MIRVCTLLATNHCWFVLHVLESSIFLIVAVVNIHAVITYFSQILGHGDFDDITECLEALMDDEKTIYSLGIALNLKQKAVKELREEHSDTFLDDIITAWLEETDRPTWRSMLKALKHRRVRRNSLADQIAEDKGFGRVE